MELGSVGGIVLIVLVILAGYQILQIFTQLNSPTFPILNTTNFTVRIEPLTNQTLRWNHFPLAFYINTSLIKQNPNYAEDIKQALQLWQTATNNLASFMVTNDPSSADVTVEWVSNLKEKSTDTLGNTDLKFINITGFNLILNAKIELLTRSSSRQLSDTDMTNLALHEVGHSLGLSHSSDENDIMYPILLLPSSSVKKISPADIQNLKTAYQLQPKPDLTITEANLTKATIKRFGWAIYLANISLTIQNIGLSDANPSKLQINADGISVKQENLPAIPVGDRLTIFLGNLKIDNDFNSIDLIVDPTNLIDELNKTNNVVRLTVT